MDTRTSNGNSYDLDPNGSTLKMCTDGIRDLNRFRFVCFRRKYHSTTKISTTKKKKLIKKERQKLEQTNPFGKVPYQ